MFILPIPIVCAALLSLPSASARPAEACCQLPAAEASREAASAPLERLKALAGTWVRLGEDGAATDEIISQVRITAGGSAVIETLFPGTDHEMITLYHMDGDDLVLTHYCVLGNQPHMKATTIAEDRIVFTCDETGVESADEAHMHQGTIVWAGEDRLKTEWLQFTKGAKTYTASFDIVRRAK